MAVELCPLTQVLSGLPGYLISIEQQLIVPLAVHCCQRGGPARVLTLIRPTLITGGRNLDIEIGTGQCVDLGPHWEIPMQCNGHSLFHENKNSVVIILSHRYVIYK